MTAVPGSLVVILGVSAVCDDCNQPLPEIPGGGQEGVAGDVVGDRQYVVCATCSVPGVAHHLFADREVA